MPKKDLFRDIKTKLVAAGDTVIMPVEGGYHGVRATTPGVLFTRLAPDNDPLFVPIDVLRDVLARFDTALSNHEPPIITKVNPLTVLALVRPEITIEATPHHFICTVATGTQLSDEDRTLTTLACKALAAEGGRTIITVSDWMSSERIATAKTDALRYDVFNTPLLPSEIAALNVTIQAHRTRTL